MLVPSNFTQLLTEWREGHPQALERLTPLVYDELRRLARNYMKGERGSHTLQATAVVHEAFLRLIQANVALQDRAHFFALGLAADAAGVGGSREVTGAHQTQTPASGSPPRRTPLPPAARHRRDRAR